MSDADKGSREFDLYFLYGSVKVISKNEVFILHEEKIHVVEHSAYLAIQKELDAMLNNRNHYCNVYQKAQKQLAEAQEQIKDYKSVLEKISQGPDIPLIKMNKAELLDFIARFAQRKARETLNKWKQSDT